MERLAAAAGPEDIRAIISLIARQGSVFIYRHPDFVKSILTLLPRFPVKDSAELRARLIASGRPGGWGAQNGELDPQFGYALEEARRAQAHSSNDPLLAAFYREIISDEEELRETLRRRFQERA